MSTVDGQKKVGTKMLTYDKVVIDFRQDGEISRVEGKCLSTDEKPSDVGNGSSLIEMDTGTVYFFDENAKQWIPFE